MVKYLKSYKEYPAGTLVICKSYTLLERMWHWLLRKRRACNSLFVMPGNAFIGLPKWDLIKDDYYVCVPKTPYSRKELALLSKISISCKSTKDYLTMLNIIRPYSVNVNGPLEQFKTNKNYKLIYLYQEPLQEIMK